MVRLAQQNTYYFKITYVIMYAVKNKYILLCIQWVKHSYIHICIFAQINLI